MYPIKKQHRSEFVPIRTQTYHVQVWGEPSPSKVPLVMVHGWMDVAASYQFVVDAFAQDHYIIAPDWRGYGQSTSAGKVDNYWFPDYLADLDFLLDHYVGDTPVNLVGHSMGGNVAMMYGGVRPQRIRRLVNLEGFGLPASKPHHAVKRYAQWLDELKALHRGEMDLKTYESVDQVARRLMKNNRRLGEDKALWLAQHWAREDGRWSVVHPGRSRPQGLQRPHLPRGRSPGPVRRPEHAGAGRGSQRRQPDRLVARQVHPGGVPRAAQDRAPCGGGRGAGCGAHAAPRPAGGAGGID